MKLFFCCFLAFWLGATRLPAQAPESLNASQILLQMKKLKVLGSVLYIAAHPDDENTRLLAWLSQDQLYRTGYLSLTRGDGGQNLLGDEQGVELGLIRTQELLAARRIDGAEQFFSRAFDFGFTKTTQEALRIWDQQKILSDVVWVIRKFQPDVIITRFPEDRRAGHGQHSASSVLAHLAFAAAADPRQFPEQLQYGVQPWQAKRLFWNNYNFGGLNTTRDDQLKIEVGGYNPLLGKSYGEIAAESRSQHRSQGFGVARSQGHSLEYFSLTAGKPASRSLMDDVDFSWRRLPGGAAIQTLIDGIIKKYNPADPSASLRDLVALYEKMAGLADGYWKKKKMAELVDLLEACSGLSLEATVDRPYGVQDQSLGVRLHVINRSRADVELTGVSLHHTDTAWQQKLDPEENYDVTLRVSLAGMPISQPYWLKAPMATGSYNVDDQTLIGDAQNKPALMADFRLRIQGQAVVIQKAVRYDFTEPARGESFEPFVIVPATLAVCDPQILLFAEKKEKALTLRSESKADKSETGAGQSAGALSLTPAPGFIIRKDSVLSGGQVQSFRIGATDGHQAPEWTWAVETEGGRTDSVMRCRTISYEHIPRIDYFKPVQAKLLSTDLQIRGSRIGYVEGAGDKVPDALREMGYQVTLLTETNLTAATLATLDAVITGVRAYDVHDWLFGKYGMLMDFVSKGGNLIVQYNRNNSDRARTHIGPYPFSVSNNRVTEEDAAVRFLHPDHPVLHFPNQISPADFDGWIQERGIYFATRADDRYQDMFGMHDTGEQDQPGSLITTTYGKGNFTYTGLVFFRELPAAVPGAYRLLANIIALNQNSHK